MLSDWTDQDPGEVFAKLKKMDGYYNSASAVDLITNTRSVKTSVIVDDGNIIVLGGLIDDQVQETVQKVPLLGDIPLLGLLFKSKSTSKQKRNLMIFMRPTIIRDSAVTSQLTSSKYNYIRTQQMEARKRGLLLMPNQDSPLLPALNEFLAEPPPFKEVPFEDNTQEKSKKSSDNGNDTNELTQPADSVDKDKLNQLDPIDSTPPQTQIQTEEVASRPPLF